MVVVVCHDSSALGQLMELCAMVITMSGTRRGEGLVSSATVS